MISSKWPARIAANARSWLVSEYRSISSRDRFHFSAISSEPRNCEISWSPYRCNHCLDSLVGEVNPNCSPTVIADEIGIWLMFCTPPATMTSAVPDMIACAPKEIACWLDPHWRSTVTPGTSSG
ncbi:Uncharacterised protein [Mycobacterium tuberculosis]|nr:Uncharacterised protein [Mycobacterium tuberculosis]